VLCGVLEHLKIETRLINERFASVMGECDLEVENTRFMYHLDNSIVPTAEKKIKIGTSVKKSAQPKTRLCEECPAKEPTAHIFFFEFTRHGSFCVYDVNYVISNLPSSVERTILDALIFRTKVSVS
jgi:hypothetical protein